jgi:polyadenylation factor subunit 2
MATTAVQTLPVLLAQTVQHNTGGQEWQPTKYKQPPQPPPPDEAMRRDMEMAAARQVQDGKALKKIRPRRTVDYGGNMGRWILVRLFDSSSWGVHGVYR